MLGAKSSLLHQVPFWGLCNRESAGKLRVSYFNPPSSCHREYKEQLVIKHFSKWDGITYKMLTPGLEAVEIYRSECCVSPNFFKKEKRK